MNRHGDLTKRAQRPILNRPDVLACHEAREAPRRYLRSLPTRNVTGCIRQTAAVTGGSCRLRDAIHPRSRASANARQPAYHRHMDTPDSLVPAARLAAIEATAGSADDIFEPGYLCALREDWPD